jgi:hypothetical protein
MYRCWFYTMKKKSDDKTGNKRVQRLLQRSLTFFLFFARNKRRVTPETLFLQNSQRKTPSFETFSVCLLLPLGKKKDEASCCCSRFQSYDSAKWEREREREREKGQLSFWPTAFLSFSHHLISNFQSWKRVSHWNTKFSEWKEEDFFRPRWRWPRILFSFLWQQKTLFVIEKETGQEWTAFISRVTRSSSSYHSSGHVWDHECHCLLFYFRIGSESLNWLVSRHMTSERKRGQRSDRFILSLKTYNRRETAVHTNVRIIHHLMLRQKARVTENETMRFTWINIRNQPISS